MKHTQEEMDRLITIIFNPSPITTATRAIVYRLYRYSEGVAGFTDDDARNGTNPRSGWPLRARASDWLGDRLDDLGLWANRRRARRRR